MAADIINLDRDGAVSFIPRRDVRYQRAVPPEYAGASALPHCETFTMGDPDTKTLYNPGWPGNYPNNSDCVVVLEAPVGFLVRLDFRDHFHVEPSEECKYDFLEVRGRWEGTKWHRGDCDLRPKPHTHASGHNVTAVAVM